MHQEVGTLALELALRRPGQLVGHDDPEGRVHAGQPRGHQPTRGPDPESGRAIRRLVIGHPLDAELFDQMPHVGELADVGDPDHGQGAGLHRRVLLLGCRRFDPVYRPTPFRLKDTPQGGRMERRRVVRWLGPSACCTSASRELRGLTEHLSPGVC